MIADAHEPPPDGTPHKDSQTQRVGSSGSDDSVGLTLTEAEIFEITGYRRAAEQLAWFKALGVQAKRRVDGTVSVARWDYLRHGAAIVAGATATVEPRPGRQSDRKNGCR